MLFCTQNNDFNVIIWMTFVAINNNLYRYYLQAYTVSRVNLLYDRIMYLIYIIICIELLKDYFFCIIMLTVYTYLLSACSCIVMNSICCSKLYLIIY